jgi:general stress protein 26
MPGQVPFRQVDLSLGSFQRVWLGTTRFDGHPHSVPVCYWWDGETKRMYFVSNRNAVKTQNLMHQPQVVIHASDGDDTIILEGAATRVTNTDEHNMVKEHWIEKYNTPYSDSKSEVLYCVQVAHVVVWHYGGGVNARTDWHFEAMALA